MSRPRDSQRKRVYDSERAIDPRPLDKTLGREKSTLGGRLETVNEIEDYLSAIHRSRWFKGFCCRQSAIINKYFVGDGRGSIRGQARLWQNGNAEIKLPRWTRSKLYILHELAHTVTDHRKDVASHGPDYCANYLELVRRWIGPDAHAALKDSFKQHRVKYRRTSK